MPDFCACEWAEYPPSRHTDGTPVLCSRCRKPRRCEFEYMGEGDDVETLEPCEPSPVATRVHIDYVTCARHYDRAVDNVSSR